jgi:hypothetical protein
MAILECPLRAKSGCLLRGSATFPRAFRFCRRSDEIRVRITPAATASNDIRPTIFKRAILAIPILATFNHGAPGCYVGRRRQAEGQMTNSHPDYRNLADHRHPLWLVLVRTTNNRSASFFVVILLRVKRRHKGRKRSYLLWVKSRHLRRTNPCLLYAQNRTCALR